MGNITHSNREYYFVSGLPRSGSTLLCNVLAQNPRFRSDAVTSNLAGFLQTTCENFDKADEIEGWKNSDRKRRIIRSIFHAYYEDSAHPVVIEKSRTWLAQIELLEMILGKKAKIICTVRDLRAIMASWEKLRRRNFDSTSDIPFDYLPTVETRISHWCSTRSPTGLAYSWLKDALSRNLGDRLLFVDFNKLCIYPDQQMKRIYKFLGEKPFRHDFENVEQATVEKDPAPWMKDLHLIRKKVEPVPVDWPEVLGPDVHPFLEKMNNLWHGRI
jgi:sulfotransferase